MGESKWKTKAMLLYRWVRLSQNGVSVHDLIVNRGYKTVAVYGFTEIAKCIFYETKPSNLVIKYLVDKKGESISFDYPIISSDEFTGEDVDAVIVTLVNDEDAVQEIKKSAKCDVITIEEVLYEL